MARHFILVRPIGMVMGGTIIEYTAADIGALYTDLEIARLSQGLKVYRDGVTHLDMAAFVRATELDQSERDRRPLPQRLLRAVAGLA